MSTTAEAKVLVYETNALNLLNWLSKYEHLFLDFSLENENDYLEIGKVLKSENINRFCCK
jgi:hypothetical protein